MGRVLQARIFSTTCVLRNTSLEYHSDATAPVGGDSKELLPNSNHAVAGSAPTLATEGPKYGICWYAEMPEAVTAAAAAAATFELAEYEVAAVKFKDDDGFFTLGFLEMVFFFLFLLP